MSLKATLGAILRRSELRSKKSKKCACKTPLKYLELTRLWVYQARPEEILIICTRNFHLLASHAYRWSFSSQVGSSSLVHMKYTEPATGRPLDQVDSIPHIEFKNDLTGRFRM